MKIQVATAGDPSVGYQGEYVEIDWTGSAREDFGNLEEVREHIQQSWSDLLDSKVTVWIEGDPPDCDTEIEENG